MLFYLTNSIDARNIVNIAVYVTQNINLQNCAVVTFSHFKLPSHTKLTYQAPTHAAPRQAVLVSNTKAWPFVVGYLGNWLVIT